MLDVGIRIVEDVVFGENIYGVHPLLKKETPHLIKLHCVVR